MKLLHEGRALLVGLEPFSLEDYPLLEVIGCNMTGTEHIPLTECERRGIKVISLKGETEFLDTVTSTSEHTIGLIIALMRNYKTALNGPYKDRDAYTGHTLQGKTLGILGYGRIGKQVGAIAKAFGMKLMGSYGIKKGYELELSWMLEEADIVSTHIPLSGNEGFFTRAMFEQMHSTSYFINTSRPGIVEPGALLWALENGKIAGAAVDFIDDPALVEYAAKHDNLVLSNHQGGNTFEDRERTQAFIEEKVATYLNTNA